MSKIIIRENCVSCDRSIPTTRIHHKIYGNYCSPCNAKAGQLTIIKSGIDYYEKTEAKIKQLENKKSFGSMLTGEDKIELRMVEDRMKKIKSNKHQHIEVLTLKKDKIIASLPNYTEINFYEVFGI
ncbi:MAG TPA: hypothetical protein ENI23_14095 [bacterium]|nr:hypothetical protein [bacterium]